MFYSWLCPCPYMQCLSLLRTGEKFKGRAQTLLEDSKPDVHRSTPSESHSGGTSQGAHWLRLAFTAGGTGLIPGWGTKISHTAWQNNNNNLKHKVTKYFRLSLILITTPEFQLVGILIPRLWMRNLRMRLGKGLLSRSQTSHCTLTRQKVLGSSEESLS